MSLFVEEIRRVYATSYCEQALALAKPLSTLRGGLDLDADYDEQEDCLYLWYEDPTLTTAGGAPVHAASLTSYPDVLRNVSEHAPGAVLAWVSMRAQAHCNYDDDISQYRSSAQLRPRLAVGIKYLAPPRRADADAVSAAADEVF